MLLAASAEPNRGWGGPLGILAAFVIFAIGRWAWFKIKNPSPTPALPTAERVKAEARLGEQARLKSGGGGDVDLERRDRKHEWGGISYEKPGWSGLKEAWRNGADRMMPVDDPDDDQDHPDGESGVDLELDDPDDAGESVDEYIGRALDSKMPADQIVRVVMRYYEIDEFLARAAVREVSESRQ